MLPETNRSGERAHPVHGSARSPIESCRNLAFPGARPVFWQLSRCLYKNLWCTRLDEER